MKPSTLFRLKFKQLSLLILAIFYCLYFQMASRFKPLTQLVPEHCAHASIVDKKYLGYVRWCLTVLKKYWKPEPSCLILCLCGAKLLYKNNQDFKIYIGVTKTKHLKAHSWLDSGNYSIWGEEHRETFTPITHL
ncbi:MAG: lasso peptide biosynthesis B2 protein [bacterium]